MPVLTLIQGGKVRQIAFDGTPIVSDVLLGAGVNMVHPCGGRGKCGKCAVVVQGEISEPDENEKRLGTRLSCRTHLFGDCTVIMPEEAEMQNIETDGIGSEDSITNIVGGKCSKINLAAAVDIGTTTIALKLIDTSSGIAVASSAMMNPQTAVAADVMGRTSAAMAGSGKMLENMASDAVKSLLGKALAQCGASRQQVRKMVVTGNTTMLYLLTGKNPEPLSHAPFRADCLFDMEDELLGIPVYYPGCMHAFVGADITCAVLASGMCRENEASLLCDIGTNGEIALFANGKLYVTSTAAGPAFEGAGIKKGCGSIEGAIDRVNVEKSISGKKVVCSTIGDGKAVGICGSGIVDAVAAFLTTGMIDETGACDADALPLADGVALYPEDVRSVQLAKAAICAGIQTITDAAGVKYSDIARLMIAGGFGSHINISSAARIGLIPKELAGKAVSIGNAALSGAAMIASHPEMAQNAREIVSMSHHVNLGGNPVFNGNYIENMMFMEEEQYE